MLERLLINSEVKGKANDIRKLYFDIKHAYCRIVNVRWDLQGLQDLMEEMDYQEKACKGLLVHQVSECKDNPEEMVFKD